MTALTWQALLFLTVAYFAGCCLGCILRRTFRRQPAGATLENIQAASTIGAQPIVVGHTQAVEKSLTGSPAAATPFSISGDPIQRAEANALVGDTGKAVPRFERALSGEGSAVDRQLTPAPVTTPSVARFEEKAEPAAGPDDLQRIHFIDAALVSRLNALGVHRFSEIAQWTASDVTRVSHELGFKGRVQKENWIEQAQVLAKGGETYYARRLARGETAAARAIQDEGDPLATVAVRQIANTASDDNPDVSGRSAFADERAVAQTAELTRLQQADKSDLAVRDAVAPANSLPVGMARDNLQRIRGINAEVEELVSLQGVTRYAQIASWGKPDVERFDGLLGQDGRIARENWIEQAQILAKGGDTTYSREFDRGNAGVGEDTLHPSEDTTDTDATGLDNAKPIRTSDISGLRSVRSQALRPPDKLPPETRDVGSSRPRRMGVAGDLKRIRGVGLLIERKLQSLGVHSYEDIANWTAADIDRISRTLDFKGRIERENWVEQARILAAGGQTEFSRRFDRSAGKA
jgi:predicted flap endonuclease-1-like 5' DNA nuclease